MVAHVDPTAASAAESTLARILAYNSSSALANTPGGVDPAEIAQSGDGLEHVLAVDELWNKDKSVCLLVKELKDGVVFEVNELVSTSTQSYPES